MLIVEPAIVREQSIVYKSVRYVGIYRFDRENLIDFHSFGGYIVYIDAVLKIVQHLVLTAV